jgi:hypothetical protein
VTFEGTVVELQAERVETVSNATAQSFSDAGSRGVSGALRMAGCLTGCLFAPLRFMLIPSLAPRQRQKPEPITIVATPFRLEDLNGATHQCLLRGEFRGGALHLGDDVIVRARRSKKTGVFTVLDVTNTLTGARSYGFIAPEAKHANTANVVRAVTLVVLLVLAISFLGSLR